MVSLIPGLNDRGRVLEESNQSWIESRRIEEEDTLEESSPVRQALVSNDPWLADWPMLTFEASRFPPTALKALR